MLLAVSGIMCQLIIIDVGLKPGMTISKLLQAWDKDAARLHLPQY
jgi:hypothetical protein